MKYELHPSEEEYIASVIEDTFNTALTCARRIGDVDVLTEAEKDFLFQRKLSVTKAAQMQRIVKQWPNINRERVD